MDKTQTAAEVQPLVLEVPASSVILAQSYITVAGKNKKAFASTEQAILFCLDFGIEEQKRREARLVEQHAKDAYFREKAELDRMFATLKDSKSPMSLEDYFDRMRKIEAKHGIGFTRA